MTHKHPTFTYTFTFTITFIAIAISISSLLITINTQCHVHIHAHSRCKNSIHTLKIVQKLQSKYKQLQNQHKQPIILFTKHITSYDHDNQHDIQCADQHSYGYPKIVIQQHDTDVMKTYENELSYVQLEYWLNVKCLRVIPKCASWMRHPIFPINVDTHKGEHYNNLLTFIQSNPLIKICMDQDRTHQPVNATNQAEIYGSIINTTQNLLHQLPTFNKFTHNVRNYLMMHTNRMAVMIIYSIKHTKQMGLFKKFGDIVHYLRIKDKRLTYHLTEESRRAIIFISDNFGSKIVERLLEFLNIQSEEVKDKGCIIAFRFVDKQIGGIGRKSLEGFTYQIGTDNVLDNKFSFWIEQVAQSNTNQKLKQKLRRKSNTNFKICKNQGIRFEYQMNSIKSVVQNLKFLKMMQIISPDSIRSDKYSKQIFIRIRQLEDGFQVWNLDQKQRNRILPFDVNEILPQQRKQEISKFALRNDIKIEDVISKPFAYVEEEQIKLCLREGQQYIGFNDYYELFQYFEKNGIVYSRQETETKQKQTKQQNKINEQL